MMTTEQMLLGTAPSLLKLHRIVSNSGARVDLSSVLAEQDQREVRKPEKNLDSVSSKITVTYLPIVNALIREDTRRLFVRDPVQTIGGSKLMAAFGNSGLCSLKEIQYRLKHYLYRVEQDVRNDLTNLFTCTRSSLGQGDSNDLAFYVEHMFTDYRSMIMSVSEPPALLRMIANPHIQALNMFDPDLYMAKKRNHIENVLNVGKLKEQMTELNTKVSLFKEYVEAMKRGGDSSVPSLSSTEEEEEEEEEEREEEEEERESPPKKQRMNVCRGPPPPVSHEERARGAIQMMSHLPTVAVMMTTKVLNEKPRMRKFSDSDKIKISQEILELKPEFAKHLKNIFAKHNVTGLVADTLLVPTLSDLDRLSVEVLHEIQQYAKCVKTLTKERKRPGRKRKEKTSLSE